MKRLIVEDSGLNKRLDIWLTEQLAPDFSRTRVQAMIKADAVTIDGRIVQDSKAKLGLGQIVEVVLPEIKDDSPLPQQLDLDILYEDNDLLVLNKPAGLVVHPGNGNWDGTLVNALLYHCKDSLSGIGGIKRPGIVHRLDKDTSGVMIVAKNDFSHKNLSEQFADHGRSGHLKRVYQAFVWGGVQPISGKITSYLGRDRGDRLRRAVVKETQADAKLAITHYSVIENYYLENKLDPIINLVECSLETGRTHQIRVHMEHVGHPLLGDKIYGKAFLSKINLLPPNLQFLVAALQRQALHAKSLRFMHPRSGEILQFVAELPPDLQIIKDKLQEIASRG